MSNGTAACADRADSSHLENRATPGDTSAQHALLKSTDLSAPENCKLITPGPGTQGELRHLPLVSFEEEPKRGDGGGREGGGDGHETGHDRTSTKKPDGSEITLDEKGRVAEVKYPGGSTRSFTYDESGKLSTVTDPDGKTYPAADGDNISKDGTFTRKSADGKIENYYTTGNADRTSMTADQIAEAAKTIRDAENSKDSKQIDALLEGMSAADRVQLSQQFQEKYGTSLFTELGQKLGPDAGHGRLLLTDADLRTEGLKTISDPAALGAYNRSIDNFEKRAKDQGLTEDAISKDEYLYKGIVDLSSEHGKTSREIVEDMQHAMASDAKPEEIKVSTEHFDINIKNFGDVTPEQVEQMKKTLETAYTKLQSEYGIDLNAATGRKYQYDVLGRGDWFDWNGGGTANTRSAITDDVFANLSSDDPAKREQATGILYHELANGWASLYAGIDGKLTNIPNWYGGEGQAGFYKSHLLLDGGNTKEAHDEYDRAIANFQAGQDARSKGIEPTGEQQSATSQIVAESLYQRFGYGPMAEIDKQIQSGQLKFDASASPEENNGRLIYALAQATHTNVLDFYDKYQIPVSPEWRAKIESLGYDQSYMQLATTNIPSRPIETPNMR